MMRQEDEERERRISLLGGGDFILARTRAVKHPMARMASTTLHGPALREERAWAMHAHWGLQRGRGKKLPKVGRRVRWPW